MSVQKSMSNAAYIPQRGDLIWVVLDPRSGHEQSGRRPAIVLSRQLFTERTGLAVICPITSKVKNLPFEIQIKSSSVDGAVLPIHVRSVDVHSRKVKFIEKAPLETLKQTTSAVELIVN
jgi:mRNA interferase MazF